MTSYAVLATGVNTGGTSSAKPPHIQLTRVTQQSRYKNLFGKTVHFQLFLTFYIFYIDK